MWRETGQYWSITEVRGNNRKQKTIFTWRGQETEETDTFTWKGAQRIKKRELEEHVIFCVINGTYLYLLLSVLVSLTSV